MEDSGGTEAKREGEGMMIQDVVTWGLFIAMCLIVLRMVVWLVIDIVAYLGGRDNG